MPRRSVRTVEREGTLLADLRVLAAAVELAGHARARRQLLRGALAQDAHAAIAGLTAAAAAAVRRGGTVLHAAVQHGRGVQIPQRQVEQPLRARGRWAERRRHRVSALPEHHRTRPNPSTPARASPASAAPRP